MAWPPSRTPDGTVENPNYKAVEGTGCPCLLVPLRASIAHGTVVDRATMDWTPSLLPGAFLSPSLLILAAGINSSHSGA